MADAISGSDVAKMRGAQWQNLFLAVYVPPTIWTGRVNGNPDQGDYDITFDGGALVGVPTPDHHYEVWFGSTSGGKERGVTRIRNGTLPNWAVAAGTLRIAANDMDLADDDYITIKENIRPTAILPSIDGTYEDEDKAYTDENTAQHPLGRIGPPACGFISATAPNLTVNFWSDDVAMAPGAALSSQPVVIGYVIQSRMTTPRHISGILRFTYSTKTTTLPLWTFPSRALPGIVVPEAGAVPSRYTKHAPRALSRTWPR